MRMRLILAITALTCSAMATLAPGDAASQTTATESGFECLIEPKLKIKLGSPLSGILQVVNVIRAQTVKKGDIIAQLQTAVEERSVALAQHRATDSSQIDIAIAASNYSNAQLDRSDQLWSKRTISMTSHEQSQTEAKMRALEVVRAENTLETAKLELARAQALLDMKTIRSPVDGVIVERKMSPGEYISEDTFIAEIAQVDPLSVRAFLPLQIFNHVHEGMSASIVPEEPIGGRYSAVVIVKDQIVDAASGTFSVELELPNGDKAIPAGVQCQLHFDDVTAAKTTDQ